MVASSSISPGDLVVEVGPGRGILTRELAERCGRLVGVELDPDLTERLRSALAGRGHVQILQGDFLETPLPSNPYKAFGNIPYNRTSDIVRRLTEAAVPPEDAYLIVQLEAAQRFAGAPYAPETQVSLLLKPRWHVEILDRLARTEFDPPPRVDSAVLWLARRPRLLVSAEERRAYEGFIRSAFGKRGGTVRQCLRAHLTARQIKRLSRDLRFDAAAPPSTMTFDQWLGVFRFLQRMRPGRPLAGAQPQLRRQ